MSYPTPSCTLKEVKEYLTVPKIVFGNQGPGNILNIAQPNGWGALRATRPVTGSRLTKTGYLKSIRLHKFKVKSNYYNTSKINNSEAGNIIGLEIYKGGNGPEKDELGDDGQPELAAQGSYAGYGSANAGIHTDPVEDGGHPQQPIGGPDIKTAMLANYHEANGLHKGPCTRGPTGCWGYIRNNEHGGRDHRWLRIKRNLWEPKSAPNSDYNAGDTFMMTNSDNDWSGLREINEDNIAGAPGNNPGRFGQDHGLVSLPHPDSAGLHDDYDDLAEPESAVKVYNGDFLVFTANGRRSSTSNVLEVHSDIVLEITYLMCENDADAFDMTEDQQDPWVVTSFPPLSTISGQSGDHEGPESGEDSDPDSDDDDEEEDEDSNMMLYAGVAFVFILIIIIIIASS